jgi:hypothetical protein
VLQLNSLGLTMCLSVLELVSKVDWKGKVDLDHERLPLHSDKRVTYSKFISMSLIVFLLLIDNFGEAMGFKGQKWSRFGAWCQRARNKGQSNKWISYHLRSLKIVELGLLICQNSRCLFLSKVGLLWGECLIVGNRGSFLNQWSISLGIPFSMPQQVYLI